jgi:uncharacterized membrane protein (DUF4010 family)
MEPIFQQLGISVLLGLLVGLQREHAESGIAGMRTFPLITLLGSLAALVAIHFQESWILAAGLLGIATLSIIGHHGRAKLDPRPGTTTDVAMLLMFLVGAFVVIGPIAGAVAVGGCVAVLLQFKPELHNIARKLGDEDLRAIMQFVLITCIILPVLPRFNYGPADILAPRSVVADRIPGPLDVINPFEIWLMVVLIVGLSLSGYIFYKYFGRNAGIILGGVLGGAISSTATTVSYARGTRDDPMATRTATIVILIASTVMYVRVLASITVVSPNFLQTTILPVCVLMLLTLAPALMVWFGIRHQPSRMPDQENPTQLKSAVIFGLMYAGVLLALALAKLYWDGRGLYAVAFLSGLTEMDAITLSTARMSQTDPLVASDGWRMIVIAAMANLVSKASLAGLLGGGRLFLRIVALFAIPMLGGAAMLLLM